MATGSSTATCSRRSHPSTLGACAQTRSRTGNAIVAEQQLGTINSPAPFLTPSSRRLPLPFQNLPPLRHHMRIQDITSGHINPQHSLEQPIHIPSLFSRRAQSQVHKQTLTCYADRIQHKERVISQPRQSLWHSFTDRGLPHEKPVAYDLRNSPCHDDPCERDRTGRRPWRRPAVDIGRQYDLREHLENDPDH